MNNPLGTTALTRPDKMGIAAPKRRGAPKRKITVRLDDKGVPIIPQELVDALKAAGKDMESLEAATKPRKQLTDEQVLSLVQARFGVMTEQVAAMVAGQLRALIISGAPGVGKTYTIEEMLQQAQAKGKCKYQIVRGTMTGVNLYRMLYRLRDPNNILVLDDTDSVWTDEGALNILKAATDTSKRRILSWFSDSFSGTELGDDDGEDSGDIPQQFEFAGSIIFITNLDFDAFIAAGSNKFSRHMDALQNRALYLDLKIHGKRELSLWIGHILRTAKVLQAEYNLTDANVREILDYLSTNQSRVRSLSIRSALQAAGLMRRDNKNWKRAADVLLLKENK